MRGNAEFTKIQLDPHILRIRKQGPALKAIIPFMNKIYSSNPAGWRNFYDNYHSIQFVSNTC